MKLLKILSIVLFGIILVACGQDEPVVKDVEYNVVVDDKAKTIEQRSLRVTTDLTEESDLKTITEVIMDDYEDQNLDSMHVYIHSPDGNTFGEFKAHSYIAYTQKGAAQTGVESADSYKIEFE